MIYLWNTLMRRFRRPSNQTIAAERRLEAVVRDDMRINSTVRRQHELMRENHLGPMIAALFERKPGAK